MKIELNKQLNVELHSGYLYLSMAAYFESKNFGGFAHWAKLQAKEEKEHGLKFFDYLLEKGLGIELEQIDKPKTTWSSPLEAFEDALAHEKFVTKSINNLVKLSRETNDYATEIFLHWFVTEQVEEEASVDEIVQKIKMTNNNPGGLLMMDHRLSKRK
ncbi:MAG: ferritin [Candidatus Altiarchaeota archaeon]|nr:ferritin [Candidatus Altiarchaeota archaeon]